MNRFVRASALLAAFTASAHANDMLGVTWTGELYDVDSTTGIALQVGSTGFSGNNSMTRDDQGNIYIVADWGETLIRIDSVGNQTVLTQTLGLTDLRGLAYNPADGLIYAIQNTVIFQIAPDDMYTIDPATFATTFIGSTGYSGVQGFDIHPNGTFYGMEIGNGNGQGDGLITFDPNTGLGTDVVPGVDNGGPWQFLSIDCNGVIYAGRDTLVTIDASTAAETVVGFPGVDLRGCDFKQPCGGPGNIGSNYCGPAVANSTGQGAVMSASGSTVAADNNVTLTCSQMPQNQFGYFLNSQAQAFVFPVPNSQGALCLGGQIGRYNTQIQNSGGGDSISIQLDLPNTPTPTGTTAIVAGQSWNFTCWYRDLNPTPTSNFADGLLIGFN